MMILETMWRHDELPAGRFPRRPHVLHINPGVSPHRLQLWIDDNHDADESIELGIGEVEELIALLCQWVAQPKEKREEVEESV